MSWIDCPMCDGVGYVTQTNSEVSWDEPCEFCEAYVALDVEIERLKKAIQNIMDTCEYEDEPQGGGPRIECTYYVPLPMLQDALEGSDK